MQNTQIKCVQILDEHIQFVSDFRIQIKTLKILKQKKPLDTSTLLMSDYCKESTIENDTNHCIPINVYQCIEMISLDSCLFDSNLTTLTGFGDNLIADNISIQFHHNFTNILNCTIFFVYHNQGDTQPNRILQNINIKYLEGNESFITSDAHQVSGNIGYLLHKPIIVTKYLHMNETSVNNDGKQISGILAYFHNETNCTNDEHYLKLPAIQSNGDCILTNHTFQTINFGENTLIKCKISLMGNTFNETNENYLKNVSHIESKNNTYLCHIFQLTIFDYLINQFELNPLNSTNYSNFNVLISEMGNPQNDSIHWNTFKTIYPPNIDNIIAIDGVDSKTDITCSNMILGVKYEFFYGTMLFGSISNQAIIKMSRIRFGPRVNIKFKIDDDFLKVPIYVDVMFYDFSRDVKNSAKAVFPIISLLILAQIILTSK